MGTDWEGSELTAHWHRLLTPSEGAWEECGERRRECTKALLCGWSYIIVVDDIVVLSVDGCIGTIFLKTPFEGAWEE